MSQGNPVVSCRLDRITCWLLDQAIERCNRRRRKAPYTRATFLVDAVIEKIDKLERGVKSSKRRTERKQASRPMTSNNVAEVKN